VSCLETLETRRSLAEPTTFVGWQPRKQRRASLPTDQVLVLNTEALGGTGQPQVAGALMLILAGCASASAVTAASADTTSRNVEVLLPDRYDNLESILAEEAYISGRDGFRRKRRRLERRRCGV